ncbi:hypothetical protein R1flu_003249 [Riccia fluitans]|uniref:Uncharacterized protein n=1 Tax=Riccia fluitans TaxID=41844 RepID=A0ABD1YC74_9MARC
MRVHRRAHRQGEDGDPPCDGADGEIRDSCKVCSLFRDNVSGRVMSNAGKRFEPKIMTKRFMVTDAAVLDSLRDFSVGDDIFHIGSRPLGSLTEGFRWIQTKLAFLISV